MTAESKLPTVLLLMLMGVVILLMVAIISLFVHMNQLQQAVLEALTLSQAGAMEQALELIGTEAPDFTLSDTGGVPVSLRDFAGRKVLLVFVSPQCPACVTMYPHLRAFSEKREDVQVVMVSRGSQEENQRLVEEEGFGFPVLVWEDRVAQAYRVPGTPFFYVVSEEGVIENKGFANTREQLEVLVEGSGK